MSEVPKVVRATFKSLKQTYPFYIALIEITGKFYVYRRSTRWDKDEKKIKSVSEYLGKITDDGFFIKKATKQRQVEANSLGEPRRENSFQLSKHDSKILNILSTYARADLAYWGRILGMGDGIYARVRYLENKYKINYITEIDVEKLGYLKFFVLVKFLDTAPETKEIKNALENEPHAQFAAYVKGEYDLIIYILAKSNEEAIDTVIAMREKTLAKYPSEWYTVPFYEHFNFIPLRDEFIEVLKERLLEREFAVLKTINRNGAIKFAEIDKKYGFDSGRSDYTYHLLEKKGIIKRATLTMQNIPIKYIGILFMRILKEDEFKKNRKKFLMNIIGEENTFANKYILSGDIGMPDGTLFFVPVFNDGDLEQAHEELSRLSAGVRLKAYVLTEVLLGSLCYRKLDVTNSRQYDILANTYKIKEREKVDYIETGRRHTDKKRRKFDIRNLNR